MNREVRNLVMSLNPERLRTLEISGKAWATSNLFRSYESASYPEFDVCEQVLPKTFDLIIAEQVFEHLLWPYRAGRNVCSMIEPGGYFLVTTPFLLRVHQFPVDCSRWTETGMRHFLAECGFPLGDIQTGSWGNRSAVTANFKRWQIYQPWRHSLRNENEFPVVVWALARKGNHQ